MALDSLGLGLTLDTTILEKADKTLENMVRNSSLVMQNLTRGFTAFNEGKMGNLSKTLNDVSVAMDRLSKTEVSPDFDTAGQEKYIDRMQHLLTIVERLSKMKDVGSIGGIDIKDASFYDPTEVYASSRRPSIVGKDLEEIKQYKRDLQELISDLENFDDVQADLSETIRKKQEAFEAESKTLDSLTEKQEKAQATLKKLRDAYAEGLDTERGKKKNAGSTEEEIIARYHALPKTKKLNAEIIEQEKALLEISKERAAKEEEVETKRQSLKKDLIRSMQLDEAKAREGEVYDAYEVAEERRKQLQAEYKFVTATKAEQAAMLAKQEQDRIKADQKRIKDVRKNYEELRKTIQRGEKEIANLESSRDSLKASGQSTKEIDTQIKRRRAENDQLLQKDVEFRSNEYWPKLIDIDKKYSDKAFEERQKSIAKKMDKESRKDVSKAFAFSSNASSLVEHEEAIQRLRTAQKHLDENTAKYGKTMKAINKRVLEHKDHIEALTRAEKEQNTLADSVINRYRKQLKALDDINAALEKKKKIEGKTSVADLDKSDSDTAALLARHKTITDDIASIEKQAQGELDVIKEQHEAERAKKRIDDTIRENEREKQEYAKLLDEKYALEKQKKLLEDNDGKNTAQYQNLLQQEQDLDNRITQLESKHQKDLDEIKKKHNKKRNDDEIKAFVEAQKEKQRIAKENAKKQAAEQEKYGTISKKDALATIQSNKDAKNIAQHKRAIDELQKARTKLDKTDKEYYLTLKKIERALRQHHKELRLAGVESDNLMRTHRGLMDIGGQLARRLALAFSVSQLTQYFRKLVEIRGYFEKTEVALTSIIGDNQKAQKLMNQTVSLAIQSPFTLQQLVGYTKQLAAYQVSYEELHETTKMLADVSAGLGVEMDRLILAFGQVKAANYLRATEVRQFTEAGFNILGQLADYYGELEGRMISVGEVQEMVTKRMVGFEDVAEIFRRVTEEGGMFYEMQSKQAETLAGQWSNLKDRIDVMFNEIGTSGDGVLKGIVSMMASMIGNWEVLAQVLKTLVTAFVLYKLNLLAVTKAQIQNSLATQKHIAAYARLLKAQIKNVGANKALTNSFKSLTSVLKGASSSMGKFISANKWVLILTAVISAVTSLVRHFKRMNETIEEQTKIFNENASSLKKLSESYWEAAKKGESFQKRLAKLNELASMLEDRNLKLSVDIEGLDEKADIDKIFEENEKVLQKAHEFGLQLGLAIADGANAAQGKILGLSLFGENLAEDAKDYGKSMGKLASWGMNAQMEAIENTAKLNYEDMGKYAQEYFDSIEKGRRKNEVTGKYLETEYEWTKRRAEALVMISILEKDIVGKNKELQKALRNVTHDAIELRHESKGILQNLADEAEGWENLRNKAKNDPLIMSAQIKTEVDKLDYDPASKEFIINDLHANLFLKVNYVEDSQRVAEDEAALFKKDLLAARSRLEGIKDGKNKSLGYQNFFFSKKEIEQMKDFSDGLEGIQKLYDENKKTIEQLEGTKGTYNKEEMARLDALQKELRAVAKLWGYDLDLNAKGGESEALKNLKDQIKLIRDANKAYEERNKKFGKEASKDVVTDAYKDAFKEVELAIENIDYTNLEGVVKALKNLEGEAKKAGGTAELLKVIGEVKAEIGLKIKEQEDEEILGDIQKLFDQYDFTLELKKLNIPADLAKSLFNVDYLDLDGLKKAVQEREDEFVGTDMEDKYEEFLKKIDDLERKQQEESAKRFVGFLEKKLEGTRMVLTQKGIDISYAKEQLDKGRISAETFAEVVREISKKANEDISKINFENFKEGSLYIKAMGDLAAYSREELRKMTEALSAALAENAKNMSIEELEAYHEALERIRKETEKFKPFTKDNNISKMIELVKLQKELVEEENNKKKLQQDKLNLENQRATLIGLIDRAKSEKGGGLFSTLGLEKQLINTENGIQGINSLLGNTEMKMSNISGQIGQITGGTGGGSAMQAIAMIDMIVQEVNNTCNAAKKTFEDIMSMADSFGVDTSKGSWRETSMFFEGMSNFNAEVTEGWENLKSGNVAGALANTIGSIVGFIRDVNKWKDSNTEERIQEHLDAITELEKGYERLEWAIDRAFSFDKYGKVAEQTKNLGEQIDNLQSAIALEESKKDTDPERIEELKDNIEETSRQIQELYDNLREEIVGSYEDLSSTLADSMIEALKEGEDGLKAWSKTVDEIIGDIASKLAIQKYVEPQVSNVLDQFYSRVLPKNAAAERALQRVHSLEVGTQEYKDAIAEWQRLNNAAIGELPSLSEESVNQLRDSLSAIGVSFEPIAEQIAALYNQNGGVGLTALQRGIQGLTEDTGQIIESYLNSVRFYVESISRDTASQLTEVKAMHKLLDSVVLAGHPKGRSGIKVFMD